MALAVDGFAMLRQIGAHANLFEGIRADVNKQAVALLIKRMGKADLETIRKIYQAVGAENFRKTIDSLKSAGPTVKRLDKHNPDHKAMSASEQRTLLDALARGDVEPFEKPVKATPAKKAGKKVAKSDKRKKELWTGNQ